MKQTREDVLAAARAAFPGSDAATIIELLDLYGSEPYVRERERVQLAIVALSEGREDQLLYFIQTAKTDYRDILCWAAGDVLTEPQLQQAREAVLRLLERSARP